MGLRTVSGPSGQDASDRRCYKKVLEIDPLWSYLGLLYNR